MAQTASITSGFILCAYSQPALENAFNLYSVISTLDPPFFIPLGSRLAANLDQQGAIMSHWKFSDFVGKTPGKKSEVM